LIPFLKIYSACRMGPCRSALWIYHLYSIPVDWKVGIYICCFRTGVEFYYYRRNRDFP